MTISTADGLGDGGISASLQRTIKGRYAAETRFRAYGLIAIALALGFLAVLFIDIIGKGYTAFVQTKVALEVNLDSELIDPKGDGSAESLSAGNFRKVVRDALRVHFPNVSGRKNKRAMYGLLSGGAEFELRDMVKDDPSLIGQKLTVWLSMSDDADVLAKGRMARFSERFGNGILSPTGTAGEIELLSTSNDFTEILAEIKVRLADRSEALNDEARNTETRLENIRRALSPAGGRELNDEERSQLESDAAAAERELMRLRDRANALGRRASNPGGDEQLDPSLPSFLIKINDGVVLARTVGNSSILGETLVPLRSDADAEVSDWSITVVETPEADRQLNDKQIGWYQSLAAQGLIEKKFNTTLFTAGDSREPELAGIWGAAVGSFFALVVTLLLSFPIGVMTAVYLEEFAPKNKITDLIEVNINNLAAVPSIVFGLLGLAVFLNFFGLPRSAPLVGGMVLTLMTLPTIIIASRAALKAVPPSIREAALGMGASKLQTVTHHVLPLAMPGMLTGTIIGMAQALGETAPLLMIGMVAFIVDIPGGFTDPSTVMPVQIYIWADSPERAFVERTSAAIMLLLAFLISMNLTAVLLRKKFERRW